MTVIVQNVNVQIAKTLKGIKMAKAKTTATTKIHTSVVKTTSQGGKVKTSSMNKSKRRGYKAYKGQGR